MKTLLTLSASALLLSCSIQTTVSIPEAAVVQPVFQINPPIASVQPPKESYLIDNSQDTILISEHGSFVSVPANCFVDSKGNEIEGEVEIEFTEYSNTADILLSGIPMQFIENGDTQTFQSAGMCKVEAFSDEQSLQLKEDKELSIGLRNRAQDSDYNLYYFDTLQGEWIEKKEDLPILIPDAVPVVPVSLKDADTSRIINIEIENYTSRPLQKMWHRSKFYLLGGERLQHFNDSVWWYDVAVNETSDQEVFELCFYGLKNSKQYREKVLVQPLIDSSNFENEMQSFRLKMKTYAKEVLALQQKIDLENKESKRIMQEINEQQKIQEKNNEVVRVFSANRMGIYNCDRFYLFESTVTKKINFQVNGEVTSFSYSYLLLPSANTVLNYVYREDETYSIALGSGDYCFVGIKDDQLYTALLQRDLISDETNVIPVQSVSAEELESIIVR
jgi:hypothetical protein